MDGDRYIRQTTLADFGDAAQEKLRRSKVLVIGAGGLGIPVLTYLNAMGVGTLGIVDADVVSLSNLHRQVLYSESDIGRPKVDVALEKLQAQNSQTVLKAYHAFLTRENALQLLADYDLVVDASDNFPTRYLVNDACVILNKTFIYGALHGFEGQVSVFNYQNGPTYRCLFPDMPGPDEVPDCNENGVLGILPGIIGNFQALEIIKVITGIGECLSGRLLLYDALTSAVQKIGFKAKSENLRIQALRDTYNFDCAVPEEAITIKPEDFFEVLQRQTPQLIDVRTPKEFQSHHLPVAKNIPLSELNDRKGEIDFTQDVFVICQSGIRSRKAIRSLQKVHNQARFFNLEGGMNQIRAYGVAH